MEKWVKINGYEGLYEVSNFGRIKSHFTGKILKNTIHKSNGYCYVTLVKNKCKKSFRVHKIVAEAFLGESNGKVVNHKNHQKHDNNIINLEYVSHRDNTIHAFSKYNCGLSKVKDRFRARIYFNKSSIHLGYFYTEKEAINAINRFETENNIVNKYSRT